MEFELFGFRFSAYWSLFALSVLLSFGLSVYRAKRHQISVVKAVILTALYVVCGFSGAKMLYMLESPGASLSLTGGMSFFGCVFFIPVGILVSALILRVGYGAALDFVTPYVPWNLAFLRVGCFLTGCCGGRPITAFGSTFTPPVQLMECALDVLLCAMLFYIERKGKLTGVRYAAFMVCYAVIRLLMEPMRDTPKDILFLSRGQWLSILSFLIGFGILFVWHFRQNRIKKERNEVS